MTPTQLRAELARSLARRGVAAITAPYEHKPLYARAGGSARWTPPRRVRQPCYGCRAPVLTNEPAAYCEACQKAGQRIEEHRRCPDCAAPMPPDNGAAQRCAPCRKLRIRQQKTVSERKRRAKRRSP